MNHETLSLEKIKNKKELPKAVNDVEQSDSEQKDDSFDLESLRLEAKRFDEKLASMVSHLKELKDHERRGAASNYRHSLEKFESDTRQLAPRNIKKKMQLKQKEIYLNLLAF